MNHISVRFSLVMIFCSLIQQVHGKESFSYTGKTLAQLRQNDAKLERIINQSWWDIQLYKLRYFELIKNPTKVHLEKIRLNIASLTKIIEDIDTCLSQARQELLILQQKQFKIGDFVPDTDAVGLILAPLILAPLFLLVKFCDKSHIKNEIDIMINTQCELHVIINDLDKIINAYS